MQVEFSAEDATRTDREFLHEVFVDVAKAGADRLDIPDTVYSTPQYMATSNPLEQLMQQNSQSGALP